MLLSVSKNKHHPDVQATCPIAFNNRRRFNDRRRFNFTREIRDAPSLTARDHFEPGPPIPPDPLAANG